MTRAVARVVVDRAEAEAWLDPRASAVLGLLAVLSLIGGYLGTLLTQTITYAADGFGVHGDREQGQALAAVRVGILLALVLVTLADRRGRGRPGAPPSPRAGRCRWPGPCRGRCRRAGVSSASTGTSPWPAMAGAWPCWPPRPSCC